MTNNGDFVTVQAHLLSLKGYALSINYLTVNIHQVMADKDTLFEQVGQDLVILI